MNAVYETATGKLLRFGECDFTTDGGFNPATETQVATNQELDPRYNYTWNGSSFDQGALKDCCPECFILKDTVTGTHYKIEIQNGTIVLVAQ